MIDFLPIVSFFNLVGTMGCLVGVYLLLKDKKPEKKPVNDSPAEPKMLDYVPPVNEEEQTSIDLTEKITR